MIDRLQIYGENMNIKISKEEEKILVRRYAVSKKLSLVRAVIQAVEYAEERPFLLGKIATYEFMLRIRKEEEEERNKKASKK